MSARSTVRSACFGKVGTKLTQQGHGFGRRDHLPEGFEVGRREGHPAREHLAEDHAGGPDVGPAVLRLPSHCSGAM